MRQHGWMPMILAAALARGGGQSRRISWFRRDGKFVRVEGRATYPEPAPPDSLVVVDAEKSPPAIVATVEGLEQSVQGPPQAVAITPDGTLAIVRRTLALRLRGQEEDPRQFLQVVNLTASPPRIDKVELGAHPDGLAISPDGSLLLAAMLDGTVRAFGIECKRLTATGQVRLGDKRLSGVAITHDERSAWSAVATRAGSRCSPSTARP